LQIDEFLEELDMKAVYEIHLAGGNTDEEYNFKMDIHSQLVEDSTLNLAAQILRSDRSQVKAITFEILEEFIGNHGATAIINELNKLHLTFNHHEARVITN
jgi:uncharacterized protein (UPF0276 family)